MATLHTPVRQPFGILNDSKIRNLQSIKNRQNAVAPSSAPSLKRRALSPELSDSENVDPNLQDSFKRKRSMFDCDVSLSKPRYAVSVVPNATRLDTPVQSGIYIKPAAAPLSAPATAAGRSPTRAKRSLHPGRKHFRPPSIGSASPALSIASALSGTLSTRKARPGAKARTATSTIQESKPKSWFFDIYEEPEETQDYRMNEWTMTQSAYGLDISDDESKTKALDRGKENVDPNEVNVIVRRSMTAASSKKDPEAMDEERKPLGDLDPKDFYAEGLDASSVVLVHDSVAETDGEAPQEGQPEEASCPSELDTVDHAFTFSSTTLSGTVKALAGLETPSLNSMLLSPPTWETTAAVDDASHDTDADNQLLGSGVSADVEIWESESAKGDNDDVTLDTVKSTVLRDIEDEPVFGLQEL